MSHQSRVIVLLALDDAGAFNEGDHPRGPDGKFVKGGGAGSAVAVHLEKEGGFKHKETKGNISTYTNQLGDTVEYSHESGNWEAKIGTHIWSGQGSENLFKDLSMAPLPAEGESTEEKIDVAATLENSGFKFNTANGSEVTYTNSFGDKIVYNSDTGQWNAKVGGVSLGGKGAEKMMDDLGITAEKVGSTTAVKDEAEKYGYKLKNSTDDIDTYEDSDGNQIMYAKETGGWYISHEDDSKSGNGKGAEELHTHLKNTHSGSESSSKNVKDKMGDIAKSYGFKKHEADGITIYSDNGNIDISIAEEDGSWLFIDNNTDNNVGSGKGEQELKQHLEDMGYQQTASAKEEGAPPTLNEAFAKKVGGKPGGSNPGGMYEDAEGNKWIVKGNLQQAQGQSDETSDERARNEVLAAKLMKAAGINAPDMKLVNLAGDFGSKEDGPGSLGVAGKWEEGLKPWTATPENLKAAQDQFAVHAWLGNYDAMGTGNDNMMIGKNGPIMIDPGGALLFRAMGLPKAALLGNAPEWESMRDTSKNPYGGAVFGKMTPQQLFDSAKKLSKISNDQITSMVEKSGMPSTLATTLINRKNAILEKASAGLGQAAPPPISSSSSSSSQAPPAPNTITPQQQSYIVNSHVGMVISKAGFKKVKSPTGELTFQHPSGAKVVIHPPASGKKSSSKWTHEAGGGMTKGEGIALEKILSKAVDMTKTAPKPSVVLPKPVASPMTPPVTPSPATKPPVAAMTQPQASNINQAAKAVTAKGYGMSDIKTSENGQDIITYANKNGSSIELNSTTGEWLAKTPGLSAKEGNGVENLETLLKGEKLTSGHGKWKTSSKQSLYQPPKTLEQQKAEMQAAMQAQTKLSKQSQFNKTLQMMMAAAPAPKNDAQEKAIYSYTGSGYNSMNGNLRSSGKPTAKDKALDAYLHAAVVPEDITVFRKVSNTNNYSSILKSLMFEGGSFQEKGFSSTSTHEEVWYGDLKLKITIKKGQKAAGVKAYSANPSEQEVVLPRKTVYHVTKYEPGSDYAEVYISQDLIPDGIKD